MAHKWTKRVIKVPSGCKHDKEFNLKWWRLHVTRENGLGRYEKLGYSGITITSFSDKEYDDIIAWCQHRGVFKIGKVQSFEESVSTKMISSVPNSEGLLSFMYREREFGVFGIDAAVKELESYLSGMQPRNLETFVHGLSKTEIKRICKGYNYRLIEGMARGMDYSKVLAVSIGDNRAYLEIYLRSKNGVESE